MVSIDFYCLKHKDINIFKNFITEEYDKDDLVFYLFVRSCIEKELKIFFLEKAKENLGQGLINKNEDSDMMVPVKKCEKLAKAIYGNEEEELINTFKNCITKLAKDDNNDKKKKYLKANEILNLCLDSYHNSRVNKDNISNANNNDFSPNKNLCHNNNEKIDNSINNNNQLNSNLNKIKNNIGDLFNACKYCKYIYNLIKLNI